MAQQLYVNNREEPYGSRYGYNKQSPQKLVFKNYYPSGNYTNNPQRLLVAQVETVTREPAKESRGQLKREDEFINRMRDETMKASAEFNSKVLSSSTDTNIDHQLDELLENSRLSELGEPRKVAELMSRVSNWRGVNRSSGYGNQAAAAASTQWRSNYMYSGEDKAVAEYQQPGLPKRSLPPSSSSTSTVITNIDAVTKYNGSFV